MDIYSEPLRIRINPASGRIESGHSISGDKDIVRKVYILGIQKDDETYIFGITSPPDFIKDIDKIYEHVKESINL